MYNVTLKKKYLLARVCLCENLKSSMPLPPNPDSLVEVLKCVHLQSYVWLNAIKATLPSLNIAFYGWKVVKKMPNSSEEDIKKKASLK